MADRGYESFNTFAHLIRKGMYFVIRMKEISSNGILSAYDLPDSEFDTHIRTTLTRRHTKETLGNPNTYSSSHSIHMKAFPVMLVHLFRRTGIGEQPLLAFSEAGFLSLSLRQFLFLCHLRNLPDFLLMTLVCASSVPSAHSSKKAGL